jgi:hypothetical protein
MSAISPVNTIQSHVAPEVISPPRQPVQNAGPRDSGRPTPSVNLTGTVVNIIS